MSMATVSSDPATAGFVPGAEAAEIVARGGESLVPSQALEMFHEGMGYLNGGELRLAISSFEQALAAAPDFADGHVALGVAYAVDYRVYPAIDHLQRATSLAPGNFSAHFKLGQLYFKLRVAQKGYAEMARALDCCTSLEQKRMVAQLIREEKQREKNAYARPWWNKPFSSIAVAMGAGVTLALLVALLLYVH
jgi:tetratricopeptide (TPR) repeat protein